MNWTGVHDRPNISDISAETILSAEKYTDEQLKLSVESLEKIDTGLKDYVISTFYQLSGGELNGDLIIKDHGI